VAAPEDEADTSGTRKCGSTKDKGKVTQGRKEREKTGMDRKKK